MAKAEKLSKTEIILTGKPILKGMIILPLPILLTNLIKSFHSVIDMFFLSRMDRTHEEIASSLAAINIYFPTNLLFLSIASWLAVAAITIIRQYEKINRRDIAVTYASKIAFAAFITALTFIICLSVVLTITAMLLAKPLIYLILSRDIPIDYNIAAKFAYRVLFTHHLSQLFELIFHILMGPDILIMH